MAHKHFKSHHSSVYVVDTDGALKNNIKFNQTLNGSVISLDTISKEYIKNVIHLRDRDR